MNHAAGETAFVAQLELHAANVGEGWLPASHDYGRDEHGIQ
jgi:hypothetical protein